MDLKTVEFGDRRASFILDGATPALLNSLRRTMVAEVPKLAIDDVTIYDNSSVMFDEMISHRLGLLPVPTDLAAFNFRAECSCGGEGCPSCTVIYTLSKEGPATVYSGDLTPTDPKFAVADPEVPIARLQRNQRLMIEAVAVLGLGRDHAKWIPVFAFGYREFPEVTVKGGKLSLTPGELEDMRRIAPEGALTIGDDGRVEIQDPVVAGEFLENVREKFGLENVSVTPVPGKYLVAFETDGSLTCRDALRKGIEILTEKLKATEDFAAALK